MLFNSFTFWIFFATVATIYWVLPHKGQNRLLLVASYFFYGYWDWRFLSLILFSTILDFFVGQGIHDARTERGRRGFLLVSLCANLGLLGTFKYLGFFVSQLQQALTAIGVPASLPVLNIILPVGLSFYTFQSLSYIIDIYRGQTKPARNFLDFALYVSFFPQLVAGPIERSHHLMPQVDNPRSINARKFEEGLYLILTGLFRKVVIADNMAMIANAAFARPVNELSGFDVLIGLYAFAFQIYGDFSGYSALAQGTARWLGFDLMANFRQPYFATSPQDFWRRWHISLSTWLRDYLYIPLGGNRKGKLRTEMNLMTTMVLGGLWHGANWTFVAWGALHGFALILHRQFLWLTGRESSPDEPGWIQWLKRIVLFHFICLTWLFFRGADIHQVWAMFCRLFGGWEPSSISIFAVGLMVFLLLPFLAFEWWVEKKGSVFPLLERKWFVQAAVYIFIALMLLFFGAPVRNEFIYFQF